MVAVVAVHAVAVSEAAAGHPTATHPAAGRRNALPCPRLLVRRQHRDRITTVRLGLIAKTLHRWPHLFETLPHPRTLGRVWPGGARRALGSQGVHLHTERAPTLRRPARDGGQASHLRIGEIQLACPCEKKLCGVVHRATATSAHPAGARHRAGPHLSAWLLRADRDRTRGADHRRNKELPFHRADSTSTNQGPQAR